MEKLGEFRESLKSTEWAWIAGYVDGEGCFMLRKGYMENKNYKKSKVGESGWTYYSPRITVATCDRTAIDFIAKVFGANVLERKLQPCNFRPIFHVEISAILTIRSILKYMLPYLRVKTKLAECLYRFTSTPRPSGPNRDSIKLQRKTLYEEFREIAEICGQGSAGTPEKYRNETLRRISEKCNRSAIKSRSVTLSQAIG